MYGDIDDYYKPIFAGYSFKDKNSTEVGHEWYVFRGAKNNDEYLVTYIDKVTPHLKQLIREKQLNDLEIQIIIGIKLLDPIRKNEFTVQTENIITLPTDNEENILHKLISDFFRKYNERHKNIGERSGYAYNRVEDLAIHFRKIDLNRGASYISLPKWLQSKKAVINPQNLNDIYCFSCAIDISLYHEELRHNLDRINNNLKQCVKRLNWKNIDFPASIRYYAFFEKNNENIALNVLYVPFNLK